MSVEVVELVLGWEREESASELVLAELELALEEEPAVLALETASRLLQAA